MKKFIEEDFEISKDSSIEFIKSILVMILLAPARFLLTLSTKIMYLPKVAIERSLLYSVIISCALTICNAAVELYLGSFTFGSIFTISSIACSVVLIALYFFFTVEDFVIYEQMSSMMAKVSGSNGGVSEEPEEFAEADDLTEDLTEEPAREPEPKRETRRAERARARRETRQETARDSVPEFESFDDVFEEEEPSIDSGMVIESTSIKEFQNQLRNKIESLAETGKTVGKVLNETEMRKLLAEMDSSTDPSMFIADEYLAGMSPEMKISDDLNISALQLSVIPNNFKALC